MTETMREELSASGTSPVAGRFAWHSAAPKKLRNSYRAGENSDSWKAWSGHLSKRKTPQLPKDLAKAKSVPLLWGCRGFPLPKSTQDLCKELWKAATGKIKQAQIAESLPGWRQQRPGLEDATALGLEALAWAYALPNLADALDAELWWGLLSDLQTIASDARESLSWTEQPLAYQLLAGELPLALSGLLPEVAQCQSLSEMVPETLGPRGLDELLDGQGLVHAEHLWLARPLFACWTRMRLLESRLKLKAWDRDARWNYEWVVREMLRLSRPDGGQWFAPAETARLPAELFGVALELGGNEEDWEVAAAAFGKRFGKSPAKKKSLIDPWNHSEWSGLGILQSDWSRSRNGLAVDYHEPTVRSELLHRGECFWSGPCTLELMRDGQRLSAESPWEEVLWETDEDVVYLELEAEFSHGVKVQRQMVLAVPDEFLFWIDIVFADDVANLSYQGSWPLGSQVRPKGPGKNTELFLQGERRKLTVLPVSLPEWRHDPARKGVLEASDGRMVLQCEQSGTSLAAPFFIDLSSKRNKQPYTWRQLTVTEDRRVCPPDVAVAYRVQVGRKQWLIYRALRYAFTRAVLGQHLTCEFLVARFLRDGTTETILEVEG